MITRPLRAEIDLSAIKHNFREAQRVVGENVKVMAVVKANAYGHGLVRAAKAASEVGAASFGVAIPEEGAILREAGIVEQIHVLTEAASEAGPLILDNDLTATVFSRGSARALSDEALRRGRVALVHIKVDTGMNRVGLTPERVPELIREMRSLRGLEIQGIFTHFSEADDPAGDYTAYQMQRFKVLVDALEAEGICPRVKHAANSAGLYLYPDSHFDMVRVGISLYGLHPSEATRGVADLRPALSLKARLSYIKNLARGEGVSYGRTYKAPCDTVIATVPAGYGDGYSRLLSNKAEVLIGGRRYPAVGNICMDQFMVDVGPDSTVKADDDVTLIGRQDNEEITVDEIASLLGTINYEVVCMINGRVPRVYKE
ncbi:MAG: alanine racemase [Actinobacteria bacterium]|nr:alanine racemase [Actinomycetota bacterium]